MDEKIDEEGCKRRGQRPGIQYKALGKMLRGIKKHPR